VQVRGENSTRAALIERLDNCAAYCSAVRSLRASTEFVNHDQTTSGARAEHGFNFEHLNRKRAQTFDWGIRARHSYYERV
jgi:hypothetical protein